MKRFIGVRTSFAGLHKWQDVPKDKANNFLQHEHRHVFNIEVMFTVEHVDRDIEFFEAEWHLQDVIQQLYGKEKIKNLGNRSCELIATELYNRMQEPYRGAVQQIKVQEDTENFAVIRP